MFRRFVFRNLTGVVAGLGAVNAGLVAVGWHQVDKHEKRARKTEMNVDELQYYLHVPSSIPGKVLYTVSKNEEGTYCVHDWTGPKTDGQ